MLPEDAIYSFYHEHTDSGISKNPRLAGIADLHHPTRLVRETRPAKAWGYVENNFFVQRLYRSANQPITMQILLLMATVST